MFHSHSTLSRTGRNLAAGLVILIGMLLVGCTARGGGQIGEPLPSEIVTIYNGDANFGFTLTCGVERGKAVVRGQIQYHDHSTSVVAGLPFPEIKIHGELDPMITSAAACHEVDVANTFDNIGQFTGRYRPQTSVPGIPAALQEGIFDVTVIDFGEPARPGGSFDGDGFSIQLTGGAYPAYSRAGNLEAGNLQVDDY